MSLSSIDIFDPAAYRDGIPHEQFAVLREAAPVYRHPDPQLPEGHWAITRLEDVLFISRNPKLFSSAEKTALIFEPADQETLNNQRMMMLNMDPPDHTRLRNLVNRGFTPRTTLRLEERIQGVCERIVDQALAKGEGDFVTLCAAELPLVVIAELMGVPQEDRYKLFHWSNILVGADDPEMQTTPEDGMQASVEMVMYGHGVGADKRACPADDIVSRLISKDEQGNELSEVEFGLFFMLLAVAGNETTRNAISGGMLAFIEHPDQWERLRANPDLVSTAADEIVRWVTPVNVFRRTAMEDLELGGQQIKAGDKVLIYYSAANRDPAAFPDPYRFDIGRENNAQVAFGGGGPHFCLGRHLAKLELEMMFRALAQKVERVELTGEVRRLRSSFLNGIKEMPVRLIPAATS